MRTLNRFRNRISILSLSLLLGTAACAEEADNNTGTTPVGDGDNAPGDGDNTSGDGDGDNTSGDGDGDSASALKPLIPWAVGNTWTYRVSKNGEVNSKVTTVGPEEPVGGTGPNKDKLANKVTTTKANQAETISWQTIVGNLHVRYREQGFDANTKGLKIEEHWAPYKLRVDNSPEQRVAEANWLEVYQETKNEADLPETTAEKNDFWFVDGEQMVTVPAGTFKAIVYRKTGTSSKTYWYVPGIGKVKETGGQTEELESYQVAP